MTNEELADALVVVYRSLRNYALNVGEIVYDLDAVREAAERLRGQGEIKGRKGVDEWLGTKSREQGERIEGSEAPVGWKWKACELCEGEGTLLAPADPVEPMLEPLPDGKFRDLSHLYAEESVEPDFSGPVEDEPVAMNEAEELRYLVATKCPNCGYWWEPEGEGAREALAKLDRAYWLCIEGKGAMFEVPKLIREATVALASQALAQEKTDDN